MSPGQVPVQSWSVSEKRHNIDCTRKPSFVESQHHLGYSKTDYLHLDLSTSRDLHKSFFFAPGANCWAPRCQPTQSPSRLLRDLNRVQALSSYLSGPAQEFFSCIRT